MSNFETYLRQQKLKTTTIRGHLSDIRRFKTWCKTKHIAHGQTTYNQLLEFIRDARARQVSKSSINIHLNSIQKYYDYLVRQGIRGDNPARELRLKNPGHKVIQHILTPDELDEIYTGYANIPSWSYLKGEKSRQAHQCNTIILGLMIYQGIRTPEIKKLETSHIHLHQGNIYIPSSGRGNSRTLKLHACQVIPLQDYLKNTHPGYLFTGDVKSRVFLLIQALKKGDARVKDAGQIRGSVIINWLKQHNIRQVQYMAGHRCISSTERYKQEDLHDLQIQLDLFHPLGKQG
jgi:site-specific recombinase XerD